MSSFRWLGKFGLIHGAHYDRKTRRSQKRHTYCTNISGKRHASPAFTLRAQRSTLDSLMGMTPTDRFDELAALAVKALVHVGYTVNGVNALFGDAAYRALEAENAAPARRVLRQTHSPLARLVECLMFAMPTPVDQLPDVVEPLCELGIIELDDQTAIAQYDVRPYGEAGFVVSDFGEVTTGQKLPTDYVLGVGQASTTLAQVSVRRPAQSLLDLGTGCGVQAIHAASHAEQLTLTDISSRALHVARLSLALNGVPSSRYETCVGDLFEPVAGRRFDQIVTNPPFVITPRHADVPVHQYRDGGRGGDDLVGELFAQVENHLLPGGVAQMLANWEVHGDRWHDRLEQWLAPTGLEAWVVQRDLLDPAAYASLWIRDGGVLRGEEFDALSDAWLDDFDSRGVTAIGIGVVLLRLPAEPRPEPLWRRFEFLTGSLGAGLGEHVANALDTHDWLASLTSEQLLECHLNVAPDVTQESYYTPGQGDPNVIILRQNSGFHRSVQVGSHTAAAVGACDGDLTLGQIIHALSVLSGDDESVVADEVVPAVQELTFCGFLMK